MEWTNVIKNLFIWPRISLHFLFSVQFFFHVAFGDRYILLYDRNNLIYVDDHFARKVQKCYLQTWYCTLAQTTCNQIVLTTSFCCFQRSTQLSTSTKNKVCTCFFLPWITTNRSQNSFIVLFPCLYCMNQAGVVLNSSPCVHLGKKQLGCAGNIESERQSLPTAWQALLSIINWVVALKGK